MFSIIEFENVNSCNFSIRSTKRFEAWYSCADSRGFVGGGPNFTFFFNFYFFLIDEGRKDQNATINGPSWARQQNAI